MSSSLRADTLSKILAGKAEQQSQQVQQQHVMGDAFDSLGSLDMSGMGYGGMGFGMAGVDDLGMGVDMMVMSPEDTLQASGSAIEDGSSGLVVGGPPMNGSWCGANNGGTYYANGDFTSPTAYDSPLGQSPSHTQPHAPQGYFANASGYSIPPPAAPPRSKSHSHSYGAPPPSAGYHNNSYQQFAQYDGGAGSTPLNDGSGGYSQVHYQPSRMSSGIYGGEYLGGATPSGGEQR